jgi:dephospho-CoA kinase
MKRIGLTGGIGSGKSFVADLLTKMGYPVYYSDSRSKELTKSNPTIREGLIAMFGEEVFKEEGLNTTLIAEKMFQDDALRLRINQLIHPIVRKDFEEWVSKQDKDLVFNEAAILFETGAYKTLDATILVYAPESLKIERVMRRENCSKEEVLARMNKQWSDEEKMKLTNYLIFNDEKIPLLVQIEKCITMLLD